MQNLFTQEIFKAFYIVACEGSTIDVRRPFFPIGRFRTWCALVFQVIHLVRCLVEGLRHGSPRMAAEEIVIGLVVKFGGPADKGGLRQACRHAFHAIGETVDHSVLVVLQLGSYHPLKSPVL